MGVMRSLIRERLKNQGVLGKVGFAKGLKIVVQETHKKKKKKKKKSENK